MSRAADGCIPGMVFRRPPEGARRVRRIRRGDTRCPFLRLSRSLVQPYPEQTYQRVLGSPARTDGEMAQMVSGTSLVLLPDDLSLLGSVFDGVVASLPPAMRISVNRTEIAKNLMRTAASGERDPIQLELAASKNLVIAAPEENTAFAQVMKNAREWRWYPSQQVWVG